MKVIDYAKAILDDDEMPDSVVEAIVWGCTGYPAFWRGDPIRCFTKQLRHAKRSLARGFTIDQIHLGEDVVYNNRCRSTLLT